MRTLIALLTLAATLRAGDGPDRTAAVEAIRSDYVKETSRLGREVRAGKLKTDAGGGYPGWDEVKARVAERARALVVANPADAAGLEAMEFLVRLGPKFVTPDLYQFALKHHLNAVQLDGMLRGAPDEFLRVVADKSPHALVRMWAKYELAENLIAAGKPAEAEPLLAAVAGDAVAQKSDGRNVPLAVQAAGALFALRRLNVGQQVPEIIGRDLDGAPMKLSDFRGQATLVVFWYTSCMPCMAMVPHERALVEKYAGKPFAIVGVNGDICLTADELKRLPEGGPAEKAQARLTADDTARVRAAVAKHRITWRSFRGGRETVAREWGLPAWPTTYLIDHKGVIRGKYVGGPETAAELKAFDDAVEKLVRAAAGK